MHKDEKQKYNISPIQIHLKKAQQRKESSIYKGDFAGLGYLIEAWFTHSIEIKVAAMRSSQLTPSIRLYTDVITKIFNISKQLAKTDGTIEIMRLLSQIKDTANTFSETKGQRSCPLVGNPGNELECEFVRNYIEMLSNFENEAKNALGKCDLNFVLKAVVQEIFVKFKQDNQLRIKTCQQSIDDFMKRSIAKPGKPELGPFFQEGQVALDKSGKNVSAPSSSPSSGLG